MYSVLLLSNLQKHAQLERLQSFILQNCRMADQSSNHLVASSFRCHAHPCNLASRLDILAWSSSVSRKAILTVQYCDSWYCTVRRSSLFLSFSLPLPYFSFFTFRFLFSFFLHCKYLTYRYVTTYPRTDPTPRHRCSSSEVGTQVHKPHQGSSRSPNAAN